ncbi:AAA family ATPase [Acinetobacter sp. SwsAc6]|uniref:AAA family ATPase n=1 Tax=Acinetobacter TaxID=469 RepID=UPI000EA3FDFF|nr:MULTISPECIES: AAA family ATPase [Acinetobacter]NWK74185.1 AAA family ATPase [Acinetobacter sp. SwsAc6]RKG49714.1 ATP-binding protein [Acinetobacter cumulans]
MTEKLYYWAENLENYSSDNDVSYDEIIEIKRLNFFIGKNNAGKSRFLRKLFMTRQHFKYYQKFDLSKELKDLIDFINANNFRRPRVYDNDRQWYTDGKTDVTVRDKFGIESKLSELNSLSFQFDRVYEIVRDTKSVLNNYELNPINQNHNLKDLVQRLENKITRIELQPFFSNEKLYIPILRGMRPVTEQQNRQPYIERAQKDYFSDTNKFNSNNIITGECLYHELKIHLLGEPEQRELIKDYEEKLSQYFFDNETVSLIPKHDQDVVNIKIGQDQQFPISQLGDGLQQAIILTYEAYIKSKDKEGKPETHAFFIEEPELHMHAGMVRQLMNFYLNETPHYYFFTTHSNHLLDMADESDQVMIQKFVKQPKAGSSNEFDFKIYRCDRDRDLLASLGVRPSSVYLANCTIWVEGITDRLYITKYMEKYLAELENSDEQLYKNYRRFMPNYHYTFVEYAGSNLTHWSFDDNYADQLEDKGLSAKAVASEMLLIADGDIQGKADRVQILKSELNKENYFILSCKETENTLPQDSLIRVAIQRFNRMKSKTKDSYDISLINNITEENYFDHKEFGIGKLLDSKLKKTSSKTQQTLFSDGQGVGTIKYKLDFCREIIKDFDENPDWQLTPKGKDLCERIFKHIEKCNSN